MLGLSPRVRGNLALVALLLVALRSIPACAGEPQAALAKIRLTWVYPRVCGGTSKRAFFVAVFSKEGRGLIVLHQVKPVGVDYLLGRLSQDLDPLASHR